MASLKMGSKGAAVADLQGSLNEVASRPGQTSTLPALAVDGLYGGRTAARVTEFQRRNGLVPDGIAGPRTQGSLDALLGRPTVARPGGGVTPPGTPGELKGVGGPARPGIDGPAKPGATPPGTPLAGKNLGGPAKPGSSGGPSKLG
jgi:peptidoglycan hydrolase-like protein with peptidoglycan-binding domain